MGVIFGLSAALRGNITVKDGRVEQGNFDDYRVLRMDEAPLVDVNILAPAAALDGLLRWLENPSSEGPDRD